MIINGVPQKKPVFRPQFMQKKPFPTAQKQQLPLQNNPPANPSPPQHSIPSGNFNDLKQKVISYIRTNGPVLPIQIAKAFGKDTMFAGAVLSELISNRILKITNAKIGGSPVYYLPGQEDRLELLRAHLGHKPKEAYDILKEKKIMRDSESEPWQRVALRELKDFAFPIAVRHDDGSEEIFWRWHMLSENEAKTRISSIVSGKVEEIQAAPPVIAVDIGLKPEPVEPEKPDIGDPRRKEEQKTLETKAEEKQKAEKPKKLKKPKKEKIDAFKNELLSTMAAKGLSVFEEVPMKKNEYAFVVKLSSAIGELSYLAIAKKKKKLNEDDVILAYSIGQQHKLPVILFGKEIAAKAEKTINSNAKGIVFLKLQ